MSQRITISVSNDLFSDQRVLKTSASLKSMGFDIVLLGRILPDSKHINRDYKTKRFKLLFNKGAMFYACLNIRLFIYLLFHKTDVLLANDLDTLLANYLVSKIKNKPLVYDSHEYFTEVPELQGRYAKKVWQRIESWIFPKLKDVFTVNNSIANIYETKYGVKLNVLTNLPNKLQDFSPLSKKEIGIDDIDNYIILQGAGINIDRGAEELVEAMQYVSQAKLLIVGSGDVLPLLKTKAQELNLNNSIVFVPKQNPERLKSFTYHAQIGLSLDKDTNLNYRYSLPNKIFDYIQLGVPVLVSDLPEVGKIINNYEVGKIIKSHSPKDIADGINKMLYQDSKLTLKGNLQNAAKILNWEQQEKVISDVYSKFL